MPTFGTFLIPDAANTQLSVFGVNNYIHYILFAEITTTLVHIHSSEGCARNTSMLDEPGPSCAVAPPFKQKAGWLIFKWPLFVFLQVPCVHVSPV